MLDLAQIDTSRLSKAELVELVRVAGELDRRERLRKIDTFYPDTGALRRELYPKHLDAMKKGKRFKERAVISANRVGKSEGIGAYECTLHLTGVYPSWWEGWRMDHPPTVWAAGDTGKTVRDILQLKLLGPPGYYGTGMIPGELLEGTTPKHGLPDAVESVKVKHASGGTSILFLKSYDQRREAFQGTEIDFVWLDEECPMDIYAECLMRTMTTGGRVLLTFTPLMGITEVVQSFMPKMGHEHDQESGQVSKTKTLTMISWEDCPHLTEDEKQALYDSIPEYQRKARSQGIPEIGKGAVYAIAEERIRCDPFKIPEFWPVAYALDVGWNNTAALWGAWDRDSDTVYIWSEYKVGQERPQIHAQAIRARGEWIPGVIDPAARGRNQADGLSLMEEYIRLGLDLDIADNRVESRTNPSEGNIFKVYKRMTEGRLKVFSTCPAFFDEFRIYRRGDNGKIVKDNDHLMDCLRYLVASGMNRAVDKFTAHEVIEERFDYAGNATTGY